MTHRRLYAPVYTKDHFVAFEIDFQTKSFRWGDSLNSKQHALEHFVEKLQWWFRACFSGEFRNDGPNLPHDHQKDRTSCALFAINTIEHNVFGNTLGVAHPARERARWFFLTAESQINGSAEPSHTNHPNTNALLLGERAFHGHAGPSHANHPNTNALPLGERALKLQAEERTCIQEKATIFLEKKKQEKVQQELAETERIDCEQIAHGKVETIRMELSRLERESHERARQEKEGLEMFHQDPWAHVNNDIEDIQMRDVDACVTSIIPPDQFMRLKPAEELNYPPPAPSSLVPVASSRASPLTSASFAGFNRMNHPPADTTKTRWFMERLGQFDIPDSVDLKFIKHPDYPSLRVVSHGRLVVLKRTEVRLRLWRAQYPDVPLWYLGIHCLSRGLDWQVFAPVSRPVAFVSRPAHLNVRHAPLYWKGDVFHEYHTWIWAMLNLPFAHRFLSMGGIAWRIALHYGPESLFAATLSGPSTDACLHGHVHRIGGDIDDMVTDHDVALLLGATDDTSLWPPVDIFERYEKWQGEWSHEWEAWFQKRLQGIRSGDKDLFLTRKRWIKHRRRYTAREYDDPALVGSEGHAAGLCAEADRLYPPMESYAALVY
ncbi:uncharacterized protein HD556DRAFT_1437642 [Suillus plorans]|uniref:Ubiquitin-like protease family profile domain-containing protein n=1 Tax=Suillus plorans TaxID=116603 RepID=A0A9P7DV31_9AGAM|nr:uncharacterized protein HD556DRAFT_1437642 [Suillus plorans]KAG1803907.1 hypothetical protein HD556DRAFT_1437642 [Suillus plorans]